MQTGTVLAVAFVVGLLAYPVFVYAKGRKEVAQQAAMYCPDCGGGLACCVQCKEEVCECSPCDCKPHRDRKFYPPVADDFLRLELGHSVIRILPPAPGRVFSVYRRTEENRSVFSSAKQHYLDGKGMQCSGESCPICGHYKELWKSADQIENWQEREKITREARQVKPVQRYYYNVLDQSTGKVKMWAVGKTVQDQLEMLTSRYDLIDVDEGHDLLVKKESVSGFFCYEVIPKPSTPLAQSVEEMEKLVAQQWDLDEVTRSWFKTNAELQQSLDAYRGQNMPICEACHHPFSKEFHGQKYCSPECWKATKDPHYFEGPQRKVCAYCGKLFPPKSLETKYCGHHCGRLADMERAANESHRHKEVLHDAFK